MRLIILRTFLISISVCLLFCLTLAQGESVDDAYKREKFFLGSQKNGLNNMKESIRISLEKRKEKAESEILQKQKQLSLLQLANQELAEEYKLLEKNIKEGHQVSVQVEKQNLKINEMLTSISGKLGQAYSAPKTSDPLEQFEFYLNSSLKYIESLSLKQWRKHAFLDEEEHLVSGEVLFHGLFASWGKINNKVVSLTPYKNDYLQAVSHTDKNSILFFTPELHKTALKTSKTWRESVADLIPGLLMGCIFFIVFALFVMLARS